MALQPNADLRPFFDFLQFVILHLLISVIPSRYPHLLTFSTAYVDSTQSDCSETTI